MLLDLVYCATLKAIYLIFSLYCRVTSYTCFWISIYLFVFYNSLINLASLSLFALVAIFREGILSSLGILQPTSIFNSSLAIVQAS